MKSHTKIIEIIKKTTVKSRNKISEKAKKIIYFKRKSIKIKSGNIF